MRAKDAVGRFGEQVAVRYLLDAGLVVLTRNWRCPAGELDIVAREGDVLVICEVKTRSSADFGRPAEAVTSSKASRLRRLAACYLDAQRQGGAGRFWPHIRFDVVSVLRSDAGAAEVEHLRNVI
jgi:putative endonuclease